MMGQPGVQGDIFGKLESMREVITEVNKQFKDPVSVPILATRSYISDPSVVIIGEDNLRLRLHLGIPFTV